MRNVLLQDNNREVYVFTDRDGLSRIEAIREAIRLLTIEVMRYESSIGNDYSR